MAGAIALVVERFGDDWRDDQLLARRLAGAIAARTPVEVLCTGEGAQQTTILRGSQLAVRAFPLDGPRVACSNRVATTPSSCACIATPEAGAVSRSSASLVHHLEQRAYATVLFVGISSPTVATALGALRQSARSLVVPLLGGRTEPIAPREVDLLARGHAILAWSGYEQTRIEQSLPASRRDRVRPLPFSQRIHPLATHLPIRFDDRPSLVAIGDWRDRLPSPRWVAQLEALAVERPDLSICLVGRSADRLLGVRKTQVARAAARLDLWRWIRGASAVLVEPGQQALCRDLLDAMALERPVLAPADDPLASWHIAESNGGLAFSSYPELRLAIDFLFRDPRAAALAAQAKAYANAAIADIDDFTSAIQRIAIG